MKAAIANAITSIGRIRPSFPCERARSTVPTTVPQIGAMLAVATSAAIADATTTTRVRLEATLPEPSSISPTPMRMMMKR